MIAYLFLVLLFAIAQSNAHGGSHGCTTAEKEASTFSTPNTQAYNCSITSYGVGFAYANNGTLVSVIMTNCMENPTGLNMTGDCAHCAGEYAECQFNACSTSVCSNATSEACTTCLTQGTSACSAAFNTCAEPPVPATLLVGNVNLNQAASDLNAQIVGASVGVLCGFTALLVLISMTGLLG